MKPKLNRHANIESIKPELISNILACPLTIGPTKTDAKNTCAMSR